MEEVRRGKDGRRITHVVRAKDAKAREKALAAAKYVLEHNINRDEAAAKFATNGASVSEALAVFKHGTPEENAALMAGNVSLKELARTIRQRTPKETRRRERKKIVYTDKELELKIFESGVWAELRTALEAIAGMPRPVDVVALCRKHSARVDKVDRYLMTAFGWITEFSDEWTKRA